MRGKYIRSDETRKRQSEAAIERWNFKITKEYKNHLANAQSEAMSKFWKKIKKLEKKYGSNKK